MPLILAACLSCAPAGEPQGSVTQTVNDSTPSPAPATTPDATATPVSIDVTLYVPDESGTGLVSVQTLAEDSVQGLLSALVAAGALPDVDYGRNIAFSVAQEELTFEDETFSGVLVRLDLSDAFALSVKATDTAHQQLILQSLVNTFLVRYQADGFLLSIAGTELETIGGHYDRPIAFDELAQTLQSTP